MRVGLAKQVHRAEEEFPLAHLCLEEVGEAAVVGEIIHTLHQRRHLLVEAIHAEGARMFHQIPPLPVGMELGREMGEGGMLFVEEQTHCPRLLGEVYRTPEDRDELAFQSIQLFVRRIQQYLLSRFQGSFRLGKVGGQDDVTFVY